MTPTPKQLLIGLGLVVVLLAGWRYTVHQRQIGALVLELKQNQAHVAALDSALKVERGKFTVDTVKVFRRIATTDTLLQTRIDSAIVHHTDTLTLTVKEAAQIDTTIRACKETVVTCGELRAKEQARGDSLAARVKLLDKAKPSILSRCGLSVGYGATDKGFGPAVVAGCRILP